MGNRLHEYPESQVKLINQLTGTVTKLTYSRNPDISWLQVVYLTKKILIIQILRMMMMIMLMREMMDKNTIIIHETDGNLYHKKTWQLLFCPVRRLYYQQ